MWGGMGEGRGGCGEGWVRGGVDVGWVRGGEVRMNSETDWITVTAKFDKVAVLLCPSQQALLVFAEGGNHKLELRLEDSGKYVHAVIVTELLPHFHGNNQPLWWSIKAITKA